MSQIAKTAVSLRYSDKHSDIELIPEALTAALGKPPSHSMTKGEVIVRKGEVVSADGIRSWLNSTFGSTPSSGESRGDLDGQIRELFGALTDDLAVWRSLAEKHSPDLYVGLFMKEENEGIEISAKCLSILSERGVSLSLDIYDPPGAPEQ